MSFLYLDVYSSMHVQYNYRGLLLLYSIHLCPTLYAMTLLYQNIYYDYVEWYSPVYMYRYGVQGAWLGAYRVETGPWLWLDIPLTYSNWGEQIPNPPKVVLISVYSK